MCMLYVWHGKAWQGKGRRPQRNATQRLAWHGMVWAVTVVMIIWKAINRNRWTVTLLLSVQSVPVISPVIRRASKRWRSDRQRGQGGTYSSKYQPQSRGLLSREQGGTPYCTGVMRIRQVPARSLHPQCGCLPAALGKLHLSLPPRAGFAVPPSLPPAAALPLPFLPRRAEYCGVFRTAVTLTDHRSVTFAQRGTFPCLHQHTTPCGCLTVFCGRQENNQRQTNILCHQRHPDGLKQVAERVEPSLSRLRPFCPALACSVSALPCHALPCLVNRMQPKPTLWPTLACIRIHTSTQSTCRLLVRPSIHWASSTRPRPSSTQWPTAQGRLHPLRQQRQSQR